MSTKTLLNAPLGVLIKNVQIPNYDQGGFWPHLTDLYVPFTSLNTAFICLHGGGGTKVQFPKALGLLKIGAGYKSSAVRWQSLVTAGAIFAFPQGQPPRGLVNEFNPFGIDTRTPSYPDGVNAWANGDMYSDYNDLQFLDDLAYYLQETYSLIGCNLAGHSAGGIMVQRMYREASYEKANWRRFISLAGPRAFAQSLNTSPNKRPFLLQVGTADPNLNNIEVGMFVDEWVSLSQGRVFVQPLGPRRLGMFNDLQSLVNIYSDANSIPPDTVSILDGSISGVITSWSYAGNKIRLEHFEGVGHKPPMFWKGMLRRTFTRWIEWAASTPV